MNWSSFLTAFEHVAIGAAGAAAGYFAPQIPVLVAAIPNPVVGVIAGSALTSLFSLFSNRPAKLIG